jgi:hypothetical protein
MSIPLSKLLILILNSKTIFGCRGAVDILI